MLNYIFITLRVCRKKKEKIKLKEILFRIYENIFAYNTHTHAHSTSCRVYDTTMNYLYNRYDIILLSFTITIFVKLLHIVINATTH